MSKSLDLGKSKKYEEIPKKGYFDGLKKAYYSLSYDTRRKYQHEEISTEHIPESRQRRQLGSLGAGAVERMMIGKED